METLLNDITNINNISIDGQNAIITIPKADLLAYINSLKSNSIANITKYTSSQVSIDAQSAIYDTEIANENSNIIKDEALINLLS